MRRSEYAPQRPSGPFNPKEVSDTSTTDSRTRLAREKEGATASHLLDYGDPDPSAFKGKNSRGLSVPIGVKKTKGGERTMGTDVGRGSLHPQEAHVDEKTFGDLFLDPLGSHNVQVSLTCILI